MQQAIAWSNGDEDVWNLIISLGSPFTDMVELKNLKMDK